MPICVACGEWGMRPLCLPCRNRLGAGGSLLVGHLPVRFAFHHSGTGRLLVHRLKYHGLAGAADVLAAAMAALLPPDATLLVPVPRAVVRRVGYGVDPAWELAHRMGRRSGLPVLRCLRPMLWWPRHAGRDRGDRRLPRFRLVGVPPPGAVLIDDVVTSGRTIEGAVACMPGTISSVVSATSPGMIEHIEGANRLRENA